MSPVSSCHCGKIQIELPFIPTIAKDCNCSFCTRVGAVWAYFQAGELRFISTDDQSTYSASEGVNLHYFCGTCGIGVWSDTPDWNTVSDEPENLSEAQIEAPRRHAINLRTVDNLDWSAITIEKVDGRSAW